MPFPSILYRYQTVSHNLDREAQLFERNELYFVNAETFNDPFDTRPHFVFSKDGKIDRNYALGLVRKFRPDLAPEALEREADEMMTKMVDLAPNVMAQNRIAQQQNFYASSMKRFTTRHDNLLQWAHYADSHRGYCVAFQLPGVWEYQADGGLSMYILLVAANYTDTRPVVDLDSNFETKEDRQSLIDALRSKSSHWAYEDEWRAIRAHCKPGPQLIPAEAIRAVIFGCRMTAAHKSQIKAILERHPTPVEIVQATESDDRFELEFTKIADVGQSR